MNKLLIGLVAAVVALGVVLGTLIAAKGLPARQEKPIKQETKAEKNYTEVDLNTLMTELKENSLNAAEKYRGKDVKIVHGVLKNIDSDGDYISLNGDQNKLNIVHNMMVMTKSNEVKDQVRQLKVGQSLVIYGHIDDVGEVIGYKVNADKIEIASEQSAATPTPAAELSRMEDMPSAAQLQQNQSKEPVYHQLLLWRVPYSLVADGSVDRATGIKTVYSRLIFHPFPLDSRVQFDAYEDKDAKDGISVSFYYYIYPNAVPISADGRYRVIWMDMEIITSGGSELIRIPILYDATSDTFTTLGGFHSPISAKGDGGRISHTKFRTKNGVISTTPRAQFSETAPLLKAYNIIKDIPPSGTLYKITLGDVRESTAD